MSGRRADDLRVLGLAASATPQQVKKEYFRLALKKHPDKGGRTADFQELVGAYERLQADAYQPTSSPARSSGRAKNSRGRRHPEFTPIRPVYTNTVGYRKRVYHGVEDGIESSHQYASSESLHQESLQRSRGRHQEFTRDHEDSKSLHPGGTRLARIFLPQ